MGRIRDRWRRITSRYKSGSSTDALSSGQVSETTALTASATRISTTTTATTKQQQQLQSGNDYHHILTKAPNRLLGKMLTWRSFNINNNKKNGKNTPTKPQPSSSKSPPSRSPSPSPRPSSSSPPKINLPPPPSPTITLPPPPSPTITLPPPRRLLTIKLPPPPPPQPFSQFPERGDEVGGGQPASFQERIFAETILRNQEILSSFTIQFGRRRKSSAGGLTIYSNISPRASRPGSLSLDARGLLGGGGGGGGGSETVTETREEVNPREEIREEVEGEEEVVVGVGGGVVRAGWWVVPMGEGQRCSD
ncbi:hypothetical protein B0T17DRAFT_529333 [Bombardia bombarda]|uniref:Uncharacterized protein n=1 Tax=Bombardia bombarda TaxID=252184 RepID=A0AA39XBT9_9PEZI|nr:hypothetical protein B0T17DRAFT_529333 [Bombardia bombarda]